ncbi:MAG TPA: hypothetical protein VFD92_20310 [Candidatus Binatia bacterium]|nr:hypothetical protein [Candidatus Binatia bacterium]
MRAKIGAGSLLIAAAIGLAASAALAQVGHMTVDERACTAALTKAAAKFTVAKSSCVQRCAAAARSKKGSYDDCIAPHGGRTATCVAAADAKARSAIDKKCADACPQCQKCSEGAPVIADVETTLDNLTMETHCVERGDRKPSKTERKCEDAVHKTVAKLAAARVKCFDACNAAIAKGTLTDGSCRRPSPADAATAACLAAADAKAGDAIAKACGPAGATPACYGSATKADWIERGRDLADIQDPQKSDGAACTDGVSCTTDSCRLGRCDSNTACNPANLCQYGECDVANDQCIIQNYDCHQPSDPCYGAFCSTSSGICLTQCVSAFGCGTGIGECGLAFGCTSNAECEDDNLCTDDICLTSSGACSNSPRICDDGDACTVDYCTNPAVGCQTRPRPAGYCDSIGQDGIACTEDVCVPFQGCTEHRPHDAACDDGDPCTIDDCDPAAGCVHRPACDDGDPSTTDTCDPVDFSCSFVGPS